MLELKHIFSFYYSPNICNEDLFYITKKDPHYGRIVSVLRMQRGDVYICFDTYFIYKVIIVDMDKKAIINKIIEKKNNVRLVKKIIAYVPYLDREYMNKVFYMMGQQGIDQVQFVSTDYSHVKEYTEKDYVRFEKLMIQGCEQGKQYCIPKIIKQNISLVALLEKKEKLYWFYEGGNALSLVCFEGMHQQEYSFLCGPERGFSQNEIINLKNGLQVKSVKLSNYILRSVDVITFASVFFRSI